MKSIFYISLLLIISASMAGQQDIASVMLPTLPQETMVTSDFEEAAWVAPTFPGGQEKLMRLIAVGLDYPELARENNIEGTLVLRLTVATDGEISNVDILRSLGFGCDEAVLAQIYQLPPFKPGLIYGKGVESIFDVPVRFRLR
ncbi:MAG: energy transducer TonB [Lewinella sp.]